MELHALHHERPVTDPHDLALGRTRSDLDLRWKRFRRGDERMVTTHLTRLGQPGKQPASIMIDCRGLTVHQTARPHDLASKHLHNRLMSEAHPEHRDRSGEGADHVHGHTRVVRSAGTR